jgi:hypothetical protein
MIHDHTLAYKTENEDLVMPAWTAGIQVSQDASGNIRVGLDSSTPCWNDAIEGFYLNEPKHISLGIFQRSQLKSNRDGRAE